MKILHHTLLSCSLALFIIKDISAKPVSKESVLCVKRNLITMIAFRTKEYNVAICKEFGDAYHFIAQEVKTNNQIFLPIIEKNNPYTGSNPWLLKARNGQFTYQILEFNPLSNGSYVSLTIFKNGNRTYYHTTNTYIRSDE